MIRNIYPLHIDTAVARAGYEWLKARKVYNHDLEK